VELQGSQLRLLLGQSRRCRFQLGLFPSPIRPLSFSVLGTKGALERRISNYFLNENDKETLDSVGTEQ
jgi:hypothetical protein